MRALLLVAFASALLGIAWLVSRGGSGEGPAVEPSGPGEERPVGESEPVSDASPGELPEERVAVGEDGSDAVEPEPEPIPSETPLEGVRRRIDPGDALLVVRVLTPEGEPLPQRLLFDQIANRGRVELEVRLSYESIEAGTVIPLARERGEDSPFVEVREHYTAAIAPEALAVLSFRPEAPTVFVALLANRRVLAVQHVLCDIGEVEFVVSVDEARTGHASFRARFVDGGGKPVERVLLISHDSRSWGEYGHADLYGRVRILPEEATSDPDGRVEVGPLPPGIYEYDASHRAFATTFLRIELEAGEALDLGTIALAEPLTIAGRLVGPEEEVGGREVLIRRVPAVVEPRGRDLDREVISDREGRFGLTNVEPGSYAVRVASQERVTAGRRQNRPLAYLSPFVWVDATWGSVEDAAIELEPGNWVTIRSRYAGEEPVELRVVDAGGLTLDRQVSDPGVLATYWFLPSGRLRLEVTRAGSTEALEFESVPGAELDVGP